MCAMKLRGARMASLVLACSLALTGCANDDDTKKSDKKPSATPSVDAGLTKAGTELELGETATVAWAPNQRVKGTIGVTVTRFDEGAKTDVTAIKVDPPLKDPHLYYVRFRLENKGDTDLSGISALSLPMYLDDGSPVLMPAADVRLAFKPCPLAKLPVGFTKGKTADLCLVYVLDSTMLEKISLRPNAADASITWTGPITPAVKPKPKPKPTATATP